MSCQGKFAPIWVCILLFSLTNPLWAGVYDGGSGTSADPYQIRTAEQLNTIGTQISDWDKNFIQTADIDMSAYSGTQFHLIGLVNYPFKGVYDGGGFSIRNFTFITASFYHGAGLFSYVSGARIQNVKLENVMVSIGGDYAGALAGYMESGTIENCSSSGNISGADYTGGLVGYQEYTVLKNCSTQGTVTGFSPYHAHAGGLAGYQVYGLTSDCSSAAEVSAATYGDTYYTYAGGLVGYSLYGSISRCGASGGISSYSTSNAFAGGLAAFQSYGMIDRCFNSGSVSASTASADYNVYTGGLVGYQSGGFLENCYSTGGVDCPAAWCYISCTGGLVGFQNTFSIVSIKNCYSAGSVSSLGTYVYRGGILGYQAGEEEAVIQCLWDWQVCNTVCGVGNGPDPVGCCPKLTEQMKWLATYAASGWDCTDTDGDPSDWKNIRDGEDYPRLAWQEEYAGDIAGLYGVDVEDLMEITDYWLLDNCDANCEQADIDQNGSVNMADFLKLAADWRKGL